MVTATAERRTTRRQERIMIAILILAAITAMGAYTALVGWCKLDRLDYVLNLVMLCCAAACLVLQVMT